MKGASPQRVRVPPSRPRAGSFHPVAIRAATEEPKSSEPPDRDYYLRIDKDSVEIRKQYLEHIRKTLAMADHTPDPSQTASRILEIETALARSWMDEVKRQDFTI